MEIVVLAHGVLKYGENNWPAIGKALRNYSESNLQFTGPDGEFIGSNILEISREESFFEPSVSDMIVF
jgi:hypothetical protein